MSAVARRTRRELIVANADIVRLRNENQALRGRLERANAEAEAAKVLADDRLAQIIRLKVEEDYLHAELAKVDQSQRAAAEPAEVQS